MLLGPLHKVLHLYAVLGNLNSYHESYRSGRDAALKSMMQQVWLVYLVGTHLLNVVFR